MGLFDLKGNYFKTAHAFQAMAKMSDTPRRLSVTGNDTFGFATLAGRSADGKTVQILISNYAIPAGYKPHDMHMPAELVAPGPSFPDMTNIKFLPVRKDVVYRNNAGYDLKIENLPWEAATFSVKRYRISKSQSLDLVEQTSGSGDTLNLSNPLAPDAVELIVLQRQ
jgi:hypothetical protein